MARSGIGDYLDEDVLDSEDYPMPVPVHRLVTTEDFLPILDGYPTKFRAGERFSYCNGGFVVLALIAERLAGRSYHDLVREVVCSPAGMTHTDFLRTDALPGTAALGYVEVDGKWRTNVFHLPLATGDGGMYTTAADCRGLGSADVLANRRRGVAQAGAHAAQRARPWRVRLLRPRLLAEGRLTRDHHGGRRRRRLALVQPPPWPRHHGDRHRHDDGRGLAQSPRSSSPRAAH